MTRIPLGRVAHTLSYEMRYEKWLFDVDLSDFKPWQKRWFQKQQAWEDVHRHDYQTGLRQKPVILTGDCSLEEFLAHIFYEEGN